MFLCYFVTLLSYDSLDGFVVVHEKLKIDITTHLQTKNKLSKHIYVCTYVFINEPQTFRNYRHYKSNYKLFDRTYIKKVIQL